MEAWFNLPVAALFTVLAIPYVGLAWIIHCLSFRSRWRLKVQSVAGIAAPLFGSIGILFGLLTGFLANDIGDRNRQAGRAVLAEASGLRDAHTLSIASYSDMASIRAALHDYVKSALQEEWPHITDNGRNQKTEAAFGALLREVSNPGIPRVAGQAVHSALMNAVSRVGNARSERLALGSDQTNQIKWLTVFLLGGMTLIAIGLVHVERPRAQLTALTLFAISVVVVLGLIAMQEQPFAGAVQVSPAPLQEFLETISAPS